MIQKRERGTGRLFRRGSIWWIQFYNNRGRQLRMSAETADAKKAEKLLRKKIGAVENGIHQDSRSLRYEDLRGAYLADYKTTQKKSLRRDSEGNCYLESVRRMDGFFAGYRAIEINTDLMRRFQTEMQAQGFANGSINRSLASLRKMFTLAQRDEKLSHLPYFPMLQESKPRTGMLPADQYPALLAELPDYVRPVVTIAFRTGMRLSEILKLTWANILWMDRVIRIEDSKNNTPREIPFNGDLETVLREQYSRRQESCNRVCFRIDHSGHTRPIGNFRKPWRRACVTIGLGSYTTVVDRLGKPVLSPARYQSSKLKQKLEYTGLIFHDLRRSFITDAEHSGAPRHEVMQISGHKTESVYKRYAIGNREQRRVALDQIDAYRAKKFGDNSGTIDQSPKPEVRVIN